MKMFKCLCLFFGCYYYTFQVMTATENDVMAGVPKMHVHWVPNDLGIPWCLAKPSTIPLVLVFDTTHQVPVHSCDNCPSHLVAALLFAAKTCPHPPSASPSSSSTILVVPWHVGKGRLFGSTEIVALANRYEKTGRVGVGCGELSEGAVCWQAPIWSSTFRFENCGSAKHLEEAEGVICTREVAEVGSAQRWESAQYEPGLIGNPSLMSSF